MLAKRVCQIAIMRLTNRFREQARSHRDCGWILVPGSFREQLDHDDTQHNQRHPQHRRDIQFLPVNE